MRFITVLFFIVMAFSLGQLSSEIGKNSCSTLSLADFVWGIAWIILIFVYGYLEGKCNKGKGC